MSKHFSVTLAPSCKWVGHVCDLLHDAEPLVDHLGSLNHFGNLKRDMLAVEVSNQRRSAAEQHRDEMDRDFVDESKFEELLRNIRARYGYILIACLYFRFFERGFHPINEAIDTTIGYVPGQAV